MKIITKKKLEVKQKVLQSYKLYMYVHLDIQKRFEFLDVKHVKHLTV